MNQCSSRLFHHHPLTLGYLLVKTVIVKGRAPVDPECGEKVGVAHVFSQGNDVYDVMLNQVRIQHIY